MVTTMMTMNSGQRSLPAYAVDYAHLRLRLAQPHDVPQPAVVAVMKTLCLRHVLATLKIALQEVLRGSA